MYTNPFLSFSLFCLYTLLAFNSNVPPCSHRPYLVFVLPADMAAKDHGFMLFGKKVTSSSASPIVPATSSPIPANSPPERDWGSSKKSEVGMSSCVKSEQQNEHPKNNEATKIGSSTADPKMMKKPDKIEQCPRCNSMDTKFCYFNNYNANQPRHFCKTCHRFWTAGGSMRNIPVGAGRRRNRHSSSYHRHNTSVSSEVAVPTPNIDSSSHQNFSTLESTPSALKSSPPEFSVIYSEASKQAKQWIRGVSNLMNTSNGVRCYPAAPWVFPAQQYAENNKTGSQNIPLQFVAAPCMGNGNGVSIVPNGFISSSSTNNGPALGKH